jgi:hypothetical protein
MHARENRKFSGLILRFKLEHLQKKANTKLARYEQLMNPKEGDAGLRIIGWKKENRLISFMRRPLYFFLGTN